MQIGNDGDNDHDDDYEYRIIMMCDRICYGKARDFLLKTNIYTIESTQNLQNK
jgi:hypothetical protein